MKKKLYLPGYFLIKNNAKYAHSFSIRLQVIGLNLGVAAYAYMRTFGDMAKLSLHQPKLA